MLKQLSCLLLLCLACAAWAEVTVTEVGGAYRLSNGELTVLVNKQTGVIQSLKRGEVEIAATGIMTARLYPPLPDHYGGDTAQPLTQEKGQGVTVALAGQSLKVSWDTPLGSLHESLSLDANQPLLLVDTSIALQHDAWEASFACPGLRGLDANATTLYPEGVRGASRCLKLPGHAVLFDETKKAGLAVLAPFAADLAAASATLLGAPEKANPAIDLGLNIVPLRLARRQSYQANFALTVVTSPAEAAALYSAVRPNDPGIGLKAIMHPPRIVSLTTDKLLYKVGDTATITVGIQNYAADTPATLAITLERDLNEQVALAKQNALLPAFAYKTFTFTYPIQRSFDGAGIRAVLANNQGILAQASTAFGAPADWRRVFQLAIVYPREQISDPSVRLMKENFITATHQFAWYPKEGNLTPSTDLYPSHFAHGIVFSKPNYVDFCKLCTQYGIKTNFYWDCYPNSAAGDIDLGVKDPTRIAYSDYGQPISGFWSYGPNTYHPANRAYIADQISRSIDMYGWDSMMIDDITYLRRQPSAFTAYFYRNYLGELAGKELADDPDTAAEKWFTELKARVRAKHPEFVFMGNGLGPDSSFLESTGLGPKLYNAAEVVLSELGGGGSAVAEKTGVGTWKGLKATLDIQHQQRARLGLDKYPNYIYIPLPYGGDVATRGCLALCFANQHHLYSWWPSPALSTFGRAMADYYRFGLRYTDFIYAENLKWTPTETVTEVAVAAPDGVAWKEYVYGRQTPTGRDLIIHLVNLPNSERGWRATGDIDVVKELTATFTPAPGETLESAWFLSPEGNRPPRIRRAGAGYAITIDQLDGYGLLVLRVKGK